jgi:hypothetical protein
MTGAEKYPHDLGDEWVSHGFTILHRSEVGRGWFFFVFSIFPPVDLMKTGEIPRIRRVKPKPTDQ